MTWVGTAVGAGVSLYGASQSKDSSAKAVDTLTAEERKAKDAAAKWLQQFIGQGAEPYEGDLVADMPELFTKAYERYESQFGRQDIADATSDLIAGKPAYTYDPAATTSRWNEQFAEPVMEAWRQTVLPAVSESFNVPGGAYSTGRSRGTLQAASNYYGQYVAPQLYNAQQQGEQRGFQSAEAAAGRRQGALGIPGQQFGEASTIAQIMRSLEQDELTSNYQEFLRTRAEPGWAASAALGITGSQEAVGFQGYNPYAGVMSGALAGSKIGKDTDWESVFNTF